MNVLDPFRSVGSRGTDLLDSARRAGARVRHDADALRHGPVGAYGAVLRHEAGGAWHRARRGGPSDAPVLPDPASVAPVRDGVVADAAGAARFSRCVGSPVTATVHGGYLHALTFPVSMRLLSDPSLPFPLLGLVHLRNTVVQHRSLPVGSRATVRSRVLEFGRHRKGITVTVRAEMWDDAGRPVLTDDSLYLSTAAAGATDSASASSGDSDATGPVPEKRDTRPDPREGARLVRRWRLPAGLGRAYARASGDVNPIHLSTVSARAFGMKRMLIHGMYGASRLLGETGDPGAPSRWDIEFAAPLTLPGTVGIWKAADPGPEEEWRGIGDGGKPHFVFRRESLSDGASSERAPR